MVKFQNKREDLSFDVIGYPVPLNYEIWFDPPEINNSKPFTRKFEGSELNVTCKASSKYLYLSRCTLTILSVPFQSGGLYILQVINEHGKENFTVEISYADDEDWKFFKLAMAGGVGSLVVVTFTILVLIVVMRKLTRSKGDQPSQAPEDIYENPLDGVPLAMPPLETDFTAATSEPGPCQMPLYAVVDKTRKKNTRPKVADDMKEARRNDPQDVNVSNSGLQCDTDDDYAVLDVFRGKTPAKRDKDNYKPMKQESSSNIKKDFVATEVDLKIYDHLARPLLPPQQDKTSRSDVHMKGRKAEGLQMAI
ncbi:uncharacterized protein LOC112568821 [Pomacea canaliculata]|uniref:uncharacterized protein LOC112568821 n=1 Tax=Pomacea canaliculata TaxID=400727 RepID=UPI000D73147A|nr:uncharacterized protein LOC112568821 [Pomacea canaliculata]